MAAIFEKVERGIHHLFGGEQHSHTHGAQCSDSHPDSHNSNRYQSFAPQSSGHARWYVDGCAYFWAVSEALERASTRLPATRLPVRAASARPPARLR